MHEGIHITSSVLIRDQKILRNGKTIFESSLSPSEFLREAYENGLKMDYPKFYKMDALGKLGIVAADVLLKEFNPGKYKPEEAGIVLSNKNASIEADINYYETAHSFPSPALFVYTLPNIVIGEISIRYKFKGENAFFISDAFDAEWLHFYVTNLFEEQSLKACVCGWIDSASDVYDACLFLAEKKSMQNGLNFTPGNLKELYSLKV